MADERIKLLLDMGMSAENAHKVVVELDKLKASAKGAAGDLQQLETHTVAVGMAGTTAMGQGGMGGRGLLGMSYAFQDFTSVLTMGGGFSRAIMSITNNIDQMGMAAGLSVANAAKLSVAFTGFAAILPMVTPLVEAFWKAMFGGGDGPEPVVKALDAVEERIKKIRAEFEKILASKPFEEKETQQRVEEYFAETGAEKIIGGVAGAIGATGRGARRTEQEQAKIGGMEQMLAGAGNMVQIGNDPQTGAPIMVPRGVFEKELEQARSAAQERINAANVEAAGKLVGRAPMERGARQTIAALARQVPGAFPRGVAEELPELEPEAVARQEAEVTAADEQGKRLSAAMQSRRAVEAINREAPKLMEGPAEQFRKQQAEQLKAGKDAMQEATDEFKDLQRQQQQDARAMEQEAMRAAAPEETQRQRATKMAGPAVMNLPQTLPQMLGPEVGTQAAMVAQQASPAEIAAMKQETVRNIMSGQPAETAAYNALREVYEASIRTAQRNQQFAERMQSTPWPSGLQR